MQDNDLKRIRYAILNKKNSIHWNETYIDSVLDLSSDMKRRIKIIKPQEKKDMSKYRLRVSMNKIGLKLNAQGIESEKKQIDVSRKELKIYEAEYAKKRKDPNYRIDFDLLEKKYNKNKCVM